MKVKYVGDEAETETFGLTFERGKSVSIDGLSEAQQRKLAHHPEFEAVKTVSTPAKPETAAAEKKDN